MKQWWEASNKPLSLQGINTLTFLEKALIRFNLVAHPFLSGQHCPLSGIHKSSALRASPRTTTCGQNP